MDPAAQRASSRARGFVQIVVLVAVLVAGVAALNWPITFATANPSASRSTSLSLATQNQTNQELDESVADVAEEANPAVVTITNYQTRSNPFTDESDTVPYGVGSGYVIDTEGHVVTNHHVVAGGSAFEVQFYDGTTVSATLVGSDSFQDVAVLKLDLDAGQEVPGILSFGDSDSVRAGDEVIAIGTPYGEYTNTVSDGTVGALDRALMSEEGVYALPNLIQHSAPIYEGNSGGPLLNMDGEVIGMNVAKASQTRMGISSDDQGGIGFAIASNAIKPLVDEIIASGKVSRAYLGIRSQAFSGGVGVVSVETGGPADEAGLQAGDVITGIDEQEIDENNPFLNMLFDYQPGDTVELSVSRNESTITIEVTLGERPVDVA